MKKIMLVIMSVILVVNLSAQTLEKEFEKAFCDKVIFAPKSKEVCHLEGTTLVEITRSLKKKKVPLCENLEVVKGSENSVYVLGTELEDAEGNIGSIVVYTMKRADIVYKCYVTLLEGNLQYKRFVTLKNGKKIKAVSYSPTGGWKHEKI